MWNIYIIGAGGWGREALAQMQSDIAYQKDWTIQGFLDNRYNSLDGFDCGLSICGDPLKFTPKKNDAFVCALGNPSDRHYYTQPLLEKNAFFITIHTETWINKRVHLGKGCFLSPRVHISPDVRIDDFVNIHSQSIISHDVTIEKYSQVGAMVFIGGGAHIGEMVIIHPHATILPKIKIGHGAVVGAGAVVVKDVPPGCTVFGNPGRIIF